ncbi:MAG: hypothetical protein NDI61_01910 [Bdellovibrionaceae bacterium]|nr:hypothetical protein [Pseudobdellovibrionaceae bacterium]
MTEDENKTILSFIQKIADRQLAEIQAGQYDLVTFPHFEGKPNEPTWQLVRALSEAEESASLLAATILSGVLHHNLPVFILGRSSFNRMIEASPYFRRAGLGTQSGETLGKWSAQLKRSGFLRQLFPPSPRREKPMGGVYTIGDHEITSLIENWPDETTILETAESVPHWIENERPSPRPSPRPSERPSERPKERPPNTNANAKAFANTNSNSNANQTQIRPNECESMNDKTATAYASPFEEYFSDVKSMYGKLINPNQIQWAEKLLRKHFVKYTTVESLGELHYSKRLALVAWLYGTENAVWPPSFKRIGGGAYLDQTEQIHRLDEFMRENLPSELLREEPSRG